MAVLRQEGEDFLAQLPHDARAFIDGNLVPEGEVGVLGERFFAGAKDSGRPRGARSTSCLGSSVHRASMEAPFARWRQVLRGVSPPGAAAPGQGRRFAASKNPEVAGTAAHGGLRLAKTGRATPQGPLRKPETVVKALGHAAPARLSPPRPGVRVVPALQSGLRAGFAAVWGG
jgi:hypothetical protein